MGLLFDSAPLAPGDFAGRHGGVHNMSWGTLSAYFRVDRVPREQVIWTGEVLSVSGLPGGNTKTWVFEIPSPGHIIELSGLQARGPVYSRVRLSHLPKEGKFTEVAYDLERVFDPESYSGSKKRHQRLRYPFSWLRTHEFVVGDLRPGDLPEVAEVHDRWRTWKLAQPTTYQIMFPTRRYLTCAEVAVADPGRYVCLGVRRGEELLGVRVVYVEGSDGFDLANFCLVPELPSHASEHFATATMRELLDRGVRTLNCGAALNSRLEHFKDHWPSREVLSWAYGRAAA